MTAPNVAASTWSWLMAQLARPHPHGERGFLTSFEQLRVWLQAAEMKPTSAALVNWQSDFWVARHAVANPLLGELAPVWGLTEAIDEWPAFGIEQIDVSHGAHVRSGRHDRFSQLLQAAPPDPLLRDPAVDFLRLCAESREHGDVPMRQAGHVRAWLSTALGPVLMAVALTPVDRGPADWSANVAARLAKVSQWVRQEKQTSPGRNMELDALFNGRLEGNDLVVPYTRSGQGSDWAFDWSWLSSHMSADEMLIAVRLAARLLRCSHLLDGLRHVLQLERIDLDAARTDDEVVFARMVLCVARRWLLTLKALTWLEDALQRDWEYVRPEDLATFAYCALKPNWPRPLVSISHRSGDAKRVLRQLDLWRSPAAAIDASYIPSWESNIGMIWGLFSTTPVIARIDSPTYRKSVWCLREWEMAEHLITGGDFLAYRRVVDFAMDGLDGLDDLVKRAASAHPSAAIEDYARDVRRHLRGDVDPTDDTQLFVVAGENINALSLTLRIEQRRKEFVAGNDDVPPSAFPPQSLVLVAHPLQRHQVVVLQAAGAIRLLHNAFDNVNEVNSIVDTLSNGEMPSQRVPTNNPDGWLAYAEIFAGLSDPPLLSGLAMRR